ncbi:MAG: hypothetical protein K6D96_00165 [Acetatifactor sp.]|nr:hypothetical protein [Acetatifactor sp.]
MNRLKTATTIGCVCILATIIIFALFHPVIRLSTIVAFIFMLYAEIVFFGGFLFVEILAKRTSGILSRAGVGVTIAGYSIVVFLSSLLYLLHGSFFVRRFLILQIFFFVVAFAIVAILASFANSAETSDCKILQADAMINNFITELSLIREKVKDKSLIDKLIESIRFSDSSVVVDCDIEIEEKISQLKKIVADEQIESEEYKKLIEEIEILIKKRNIQTKNMKQGGV